METPTGRKTAIYTDSKAITDSLKNHSSSGCSRCSSSGQICKICRKQPPPRPPTWQFLCHNLDSVCSWEYAESERIWTEVTVTQMALLRCLDVDESRYEQPIAVMLADVPVNTRTADCQVSLHQPFLWKSLSAHNGPLWQCNQSVVIFLDKQTVNIY